MVLIFVNHVSVDKSGLQNSKYKFIKDEFFPKLVRLGHGDAFKVFRRARRSSKKADF